MPIDESADSEENQYCSNQTDKRPSYYVRIGAPKQQVGTEYRTSSGNSPLDTDQIET